MIEIRDVTKSYGETTVVKGVSLTLPRGGVTSIIGPNGAGKSTFLSMIARLIPADSGAIQVDGLTSAIRRAKSWQSDCRSCARTIT